MKGKILLAVFCCLFTMSSAFAQWEIGLSGGCVFNHLTVGQGYHYNRQYSGGTSYSISVPVSYHFNEWFAVGTEVSFLNKSYEWEREGNFVGICEDEEEVRNAYLQIPLMANFSFGGKKLRGYTNLGVYASAWLNSHIEGTYLPGYDGDSYEYNGPYTFNKKKDNRFEGGLLAGIGVKYEIASHFGIFAELRYLYSLSNMNKHYSENIYPKYNNSLQLQLGVSYKL